MRELPIARMQFLIAFCALSCLGASALLLSCSPTAPTVRTSASQTATPPGLPNFARVSNDLYRGAQPSKLGFEQLRKMGIKTIVNLCAFGSDQNEIKGLGFYYCQIPSEAWAPKDKNIAAFLRIMKEKKYLPVFIHCQHGADRTGTAVAAYRVVVQGWPKEAAIDEMDQYGFHSIWLGLKDYVRHLDIVYIEGMVDSLPGPNLPLVN